MSPTAGDRADAIVVGGGLAGLVATSELLTAGRRVLLLEQEPHLGGQAFWSFGGLLLVNSREQRRLLIRDSLELAREDWMASAGFDREPELPLGADHFGRLWANSYLEFAASEMQGWLRRLGIRFFPLPAWAERGGTIPLGHGNRVPRFHITWGTGPGLLAPFLRRLREAELEGRLRVHRRHRVDLLVVEGGGVRGVEGAVLEPSRAGRGEPSSRREVGSFSYRAEGVLVCTGGIGGNQALIRENWPDRLGPRPEGMLQGVPAHVDGRMLKICQRAGARLVNLDRMWHYPEGISNWAPVWPGHGVRLLAGPSSLWLDHRGSRLPAPCFPGFDNLLALETISAEGAGHSWLLLNERIFRRELALSGSEQNPDLTSKSWRQVLSRRGAPLPVRQFSELGSDFAVGSTVPELVAAMNRLTPESPLDPARVAEEIGLRDRRLPGGGWMDPQLAAVQEARRQLGERLLRVAPCHPLQDPSALPLMAVRLRLLSRKTLGGLQTDLRSRVLGEDGVPIPGLYAAGEVAGFGGGGMHGYRSLEGTFLGGCLLTGRVAGREAAMALT